MLYGPAVAVGALGAEQRDPGCRYMVLEGRLCRAPARLNPDLPAETLGHAHRKPPLLERNRAVHRMLVDGVGVVYRRPDGSVARAQVRVIDLDVPDNDGWLAVNQPLAQPL